MADIMNGRYALADPGSGVTVISLEGGELDMFGDYTLVRTTQRDSYPPINDAPVELEMEKKSNLLSTLVYGFIGTAVSVCLAAVAVSIIASATVLTGGAALAACAFIGASAGVFLATAGMVESDLNTGYNRTPFEFTLGLMTGMTIGFGAGASIYGVIAAAPILAAGVSMEAAMFFGQTAFTTTVLPTIIEIGGGVIAAAEAVFAVNDSYECGSGYNPLLDAVFDNDREAYETTEAFVDILGGGYVAGADAYARTYFANEGVYIEDGEELPDCVGDMADDAENVGSEGGSETVTYRRVQGGEGVQSQQRVIIDKDGNVYIPNKEGKLNISIDNGEHSQYYVSTKRPGADIYEFEVPKWFDDFVKENAIPQQGYRSNPLNQGGTAPSLNDPSTPGTCIEFPAPWIEWIEEYSSNGRVIKGDS